MEMVNDIERSSTGQCFKEDWLDRQVSQRINKSILILFENLCKTWNTINASSVRRTARLSGNIRVERRMFATCDQGNG